MSGQWRIRVFPDEVGIISLRPGLDLAEVEAGGPAGGFTLVAADGGRWRLRFRTAEGAGVGVLGVHLITAQEVEVVQVPGGPVVREVELSAVAPSAPPA